MKSDGDAVKSTKSEQATIDAADNDDDSEAGGAGGIALPRVAPGEKFSYNAKFASKLIRIKVNQLQVSVFCLYILLSQICFFILFYART